MRLDVLIFGNDPKGSLFPTCSYFSRPKCDIFQYCDNEKKFNIKDSEREIAPKKTSTHSKIMNIDVWVVGTPNQIFMRGS